MVSRCSRFGRPGTSSPSPFFGVYQTGSISGEVYNDLNHDGYLEPGKPGLAGRTVYLDLNRNGNLDIQQATFASADTPQKIAPAITDSQGDIVPSETDSFLTVSGLTGLMSTGTLAVKSSGGLGGVSLITPWGEKLSLSSMLSGSTDFDLSALSDLRDRDPQWHLGTDNSQWYAVRERSGPLHSAKLVAHFDIVRPVHAE